MATADIAAMASDVFGRVFVATKDKLVRWEGTGFAPIANLTDFGSPSAIAVDGAGTVWIADRKGDRIARWSPGSTAPTVVRVRKGEGDAALAVAGGRVIAADAKTGRLFALDADGSESNFGATTFRRPVALAVDAAGRVSVLDEKANTVTRLSPSGEVRDTLAIGTSGVSRPLALATAPEGSVRILDGSTGSVAVTP